MRELYKRLEQILQSQQELLRKHEDFYIESTSELEDLKTELKQVNLLLSEKMEREMEGKEKREKVAVDLPEEEKMSDMTEKLPPLPPLPQNEHLEEVVLCEEKVVEHKQSKQKTETFDIIDKLVDKISAFRKRINWEKLIGANLINIIGILILMFGLGIGVKYSIDNQLISPLMRIILAYIFGVGLMYVGFRLKTKYKWFSAVLVSGAIASLYFITYYAHYSYGYFSTIGAFVMMVIFTAFLILAAIKYNMQVMAHIGLVGAYAVPFLLSTGNGKISLLFSYVAIINMGIFVIAYLRLWKLLYYNTFIFTWLLFLVWFMTLDGQSDTECAFIFSALYFVLFYAMFLIFKVTRRITLLSYEILPVIANAFIFFGIGSKMLSYDSMHRYLGMFAVINAAIHLLVALFLRRRMMDKNTLYIIIGLMVTFATVAIPIQMDGYVVTLLWMMEAVVLFVVGRNRNIPLYEYLSLPVLLIAAISLIQDWLIFYRIGVWIFLNSMFLTSMLCAGMVGFAGYISLQKKGVLKQMYKFFIIAAFIIFYLGMSLNINETLMSIGAFDILGLFSCTGSLALITLISFLCYRNGIEWFKKVTLILTYICIFMFLLNVSVIRDGNIKTLYIGSLIYMVMAIALYLYIFFSVRRENNTFLGQDIYIYVGLAVAIYIFSMRLGLKVLSYVLCDVRGLNAIMCDIWYFVSYTMMYGMLCSFCNKKLKYKVLEPIIAAVLLAFWILDICVIYIYTMVEIDAGYCYIRYFSIFILGWYMYMLYGCVKKNDLGIDKTLARKCFDAIFYVSVWLVLTNEIGMVWNMESAIGVSIFWGIYSFVLVAIGMYQRKKYLRISGIVLTGATILKLFFYDMEKFDALPKTVTLIVVGFVLLVMSFLYNKYKYITVQKQDLSDEK